MKKTHPIVILFITALSLAAFSGMSYQQYVGKRKNEFIKRLEQDIGKVSSAIDVTERQILRSRDQNLLPNFRLQLAELYVEQSQYLYFLAREKSEGKLDSPAQAPEAKRSKEMAIKIYQKILEEFPKFQENDKIHFFLANEFRELGLPAMMLKEYETIIKTFRTSRFYGEANLLSGDYYFDSRQIDAAMKFYQAAVEAGETKVLNASHHKLGWCYINKEDYKNAFREFEAVVLAENQKELQRQIPKEGETEAQGKKEEKPKSAFTIRREALLDMVIPYTETRKAEDAAKYFEKLTLSKDEYITVLERLANRYFVTAEKKEAALIYRDLVMLSNNGEKKAEYLDRLFKKIQEITIVGPVDKGVEAMVTALRLHLRSWRASPKKKVSLIRAFEAYSRGLATKYHAYVQTLDNRPKEERGKKIDPALKEKYALASSAYKQYLGLFEGSKYAPEMMLNDAEAYYNSQQFVKAGETYEKLSKRLRDPDKKRDAIYSGIASFSKALRDADKLSKIELVDARHGFQTTAESFIQYFPKSPHVPKIRFDLAAAFYKSADYDNAVKHFNEYIRLYPTGPDLSLAAHLSLDAFLMQEDYAGLARQGQLILKNPTIRDPKLKREIAEIVQNAEFKKIEAASLEAPTEERDRSAEEYLQFAVKYQATDLGEKALYNAYATAIQKKDNSLAYTAGTRLLMQYPNSGFGPEVYPAVAKFAMQSGDFTTGARYLELFGAKYPQHEESLVMLKTAATLKAYLGDYNGSNELLQRVLKRDGSDPEALNQMIENGRNSGEWTQLGNLSGSDVKAIYAKGMAAYKQENLAMARTYLKQVVGIVRPGTPPPTSEYGAHAQFLLSDIAYRIYNQIRIKPGTDEGAVLERKQRGLQEVEKNLRQVIDYGSGPWAVAAIYQIAMTYREFGRFLLSISIPKELPSDQREQYRNTLKEQVTQFQQTSIETFDACVQKAYELHVYSPYVVGCLTRGKNPTKDLTEPKREAAKFDPAAKREVLDIKKALLINPKDARGLTQLADLYLSAGDIHQANLLYSKVLEISPDDSHTLNRMGVCLYKLNRHQDAYLNFELAVQRDANNTQAKLNLILLNYQYRNLDGAKALAKDVKGLRYIRSGVLDVLPRALEAAQKSGAR